VSGAPFASTAQPTGVGFSARASTSILLAPGHSGCGYVKAGRKFCVRNHHFKTGIPIDSNSSRTR
jgi:hypothetical protein